MRYLIIFLLVLLTVGYFAYKPIHEDWQRYRQTQTNDPEALAYAWTDYLDTPFGYIPKTDTFFVIDEFSETEYRLVRISGFWRFWYWSKTRLVGSK